MQKSISALLVIVAIIHLIPLTGVLGAEQLSSLYDINLADPNLIILMRHRAILFGLLGAFILYAAFIKQLQPLAITAGYISVISFLSITL